MYSTFSKPHATILLPPEKEKKQKQTQNLQCTYLHRQMLFHMLTRRKGHAVRLKPYQSVKKEAAVYYKAILASKLDTDLISFWP